jgi:hypothetical protein
VEHLPHPPRLLVERSPRVARQVADNEVDRRRWRRLLAELAEELEAELGRLAEQHAKVPDDPFAVFSGEANPIRRTA